jgi:hypothetical protein
VISPNQARDLQTIEALRSDPALNEARAAIVLLSRLTNIQGTHVYYTFNKLLQIIDGNPPEREETIDADFPGEP